MAHYAGIERSLAAGEPDQAAHILESAKHDYGKKNHLLYLLDRGMVLHLAGRYEESNAALEEAHLLIEDLYTKRIRDEASTLLVNEARRPYQGAPHEHVMINVVKAFNYAFLQQWSDALVEARRIDHRLNVLSDKMEGKDAYQEDPFARYLTGLLYEVAGDLNNAYVGYRKAEAVYEESRAWSRVALPETLKRDLIRITTRLGLPDEAERYRVKYPEVDVRVEGDAASRMAQVIVVGYHGYGPKKEDLFIDVPISLDALALVALTKPGIGRSTRATRGGEALLYGIHGRIARIALPRFSLQKNSRTFDAIELRNEETTLENRSEEMYDVHAVAEKTLADDYDSLVLRAAARAAMKMAAAEGVGFGARAMVGGNNRDWIGPLVGGIARIFALATEEADIRTWRTLPGEIHLTRLWVDPGDYALSIQAKDPQGHTVGPSRNERLQLQEGETRFLLHHALP